LVRLEASPGKTIRHRLAEQALLTLARGEPYIVCDLEGQPIAPEQAKRLIAEWFTVPTEVRWRRRSTKKAGKASHTALRRKASHILIPAVQELVAQGKGNKPIMRELGLAKETVRLAICASSVEDLLAAARPSILDAFTPYLPHLRSFAAGLKRDHTAVVNGLTCRTAPARSRAPSIVSRCSSARCMAARSSTYSQTGPTA
jgi:hypothetical protein